ncbi:hypothetical protein Q4555_03680 [Octadecabacter sp. 1_MG-2023]|uniref:hypothetical protein n=1 Tax=unclassified Octadecabacter TaxID=196158 RepID=UPI001C088E88|nr:MULTISPECIES: hypothetical protein [unclassified Octadecabacter]MBU2992796.1 hypothetical protein [Octadecabacter sp. B2R22]MDO6733753.1 hypothetical protein [Octadecabacter sp. 1_MG-2023]
MAVSVGKMIVGVCLLGAVAGCMTVPEGFVWGTNESQWANDGDCDDPRFDGPGAHTILLPEDAYTDANDCRALFNAGRIHLRTGYQEGVTYTNPGYVRQNL